MNQSVHVSGSGNRVSAHNRDEPVAPTIGRIVHYTLTEQDALRVNSFQENTRNQAREGDVYPALIVRVWNAPLVNLKVFIDGVDSLWCTSRTEGVTAGTWAWPARA